MQELENNTSNRWVIQMLKKKTARNLSTMFRFRTTRRSSEDELMRRSSWCS